MSDFIITQSAVADRRDSASDSCDSVSDCGSKDLFEISDIDDFINDASSSDGSVISDGTGEGNFLPTQQVPGYGELVLETVTQHTDNVPERATQYEGQGKRYKKEFHRRVEMGDYWELEMFKEKHYHRILSKFSRDAWNKLSNQQKKYETKKHFRTKFPLFMKIVPEMTYVQEGNIVTDLGGVQLEVSQPITQDPPKPKKVPVKKHQPRTDSSGTFFPNLPAVRKIDQVQDAIARCFDKEDGRTVQDGQQPCSSRSVRPQAPPPTPPSTPEPQVNELRSGDEFEDYSPQSVLGGFFPGLSSRRAPPVIYSSSSSSVSSSTSTTPLRVTSDKERMDLVQQQSFLKRKAEKSCDTRIKKQRSSGKHEIFKLNPQCDDAPGLGMSELELEGLADKPGCPPEILFELIDRYLANKRESKPTSIPNEENTTQPIFSSICVMPFDQWSRQLGTQNRRQYTHFANAKELERQLQLFKTIDGVTRINNKSIAVGQFHELGPVEVKICQESGDHKGQSVSFTMEEFQTFLSKSVDFLCRGASQIIEHIHDQRNLAILQKLRTQKKEMLKVRELEEEGSSEKRIEDLKTRIVYALVQIRKEKKRADEQWVANCNRIWLNEKKISLLEVRSQNKEIYYLRTEDE